MKANRFRFRAWNKYAHCMTDLHKITPLALEIDPTITGGGWGVYLPDHPDLILMQSTGLTDVDGKELYEDDVISLWHEELFFEGVVRAVIGWDDASACFNIEFIGKGYFQALAGMDIDYANIEIIGNIHENPELLEQS